MTSQLVTEPFALEVLVIQAERIAKQARNLRFAIEEHGKSAHLQAAQSYTQSAELLANYVAASIKCEIADREKLAHALAAEDIKQAADAWIPSDASCYGEDIDDAIVEWHTEHGMPAPTNDELAAAVYAIPAGPDWSGWPQHPTRVRVTLASGVRYELSVEIDGGYGDDGAGWRMFFAVEVRHG